MIDETLEGSAQRIADQGREVLLERLRGAFEEAATAHADVLELDDGKLERMIADAAARADGLQWRRALASVATEELGIGLAEALSHPAVARAQAIVGAPSYEEGLAAIAEGKAPRAAEPGDGAPPVALPASEAASEVASGDDAGGDGASGDAGESAGQDERDGLPISVAVDHLDGLPELEGEGTLELVFTEHGIEVIRATQAGERSALVNFIWSEVRDVEVQTGRGGVLRRKTSHLILSTNRRRARFQTRGVKRDDLTERLAPALAKVGAEE